MTKRPSTATQRGTALAAVKATPYGWPPASLDPSCGPQPQTPSKPGLEERVQTKIRQSEVSTLSGMATPGFIESLPYSNGPAEGVNTKVKLLKRQMYGRAGFALLRRRILLS
jgi:transposase